MSSKQLTDEKQLKAILDALADSVEQASDEELLEDERAANRDAAKTETDVKRSLRTAVSRYQRQARERLRRSYEDQVAQQTAKGSWTIAPLEKKRAFLAHVLTQRPGLKGMLTAQHRDFKNLPEEDVDSYLEDLAALGVLDELGGLSGSDE